MTQEEEKQLLLKDLCGRLPYGVKFESYDKIPIVEYCVCDNVFVHEQGYVIIDLLDKDTDGNTLASTSINLTTVSRLPKPYLRPMSSMTEEEYTKYRTMQGRNCDYGEATICVSKSLYSGLLYDDNEPVKITVYYPNPVIQDWLNKKMFDYRGLIPMGLALEAPEGMYN